LQVKERLSRHLGAVPDLGFPSGTGKGPMLLPLFRREDTGGAQRHTSCLPEAYVRRDGCVAGRVRYLSEGHVRGVHSGLPSFPVSYLPKVPYLTLLRGIRSLGDVGAPGCLVSPGSLGRSIKQWLANLASLRARWPHGTLPGSGSALLEITKPPPHDSPTLQRPRRLPLRSEGNGGGCAESKI
jgi:hypothetical protein